LTFELAEHVDMLVTMHCNPEFCNKMVIWTVRPTAFSMPCFYQEITDCFYPVAYCLHCSLLFFTSKAVTYTVWLWH